MISGCSLIKIRKLLVANRGEIAVRVVRAAREMGIYSIQVYSEADSDSLAVRMADEAVAIGPARASESYLNIEAILHAAKATEADAIHPGYGFLSENPDFADAVESAGLRFVGPTANTIRLMGDKVSARTVAVAAGVPVAPGSYGRIDDMDDACRLADDIGFPVMIKAAAGGGGRGIRIVSDPDTFASEASQARAEAKAAFGDGGLYVEKVIESARHIEVQILGDGENVVHCYERECSLQRRRQKVWEEAPAAVLSEAIRSELCAAAVRLAKAVKYSGAGTVEFLYNDDTGEFYFIEMNTRIQVEHPITEAITGVDLVREMLWIASGQKLSLRQDQIQVRGHAIEVRLNAEDPGNNFFPSPGTVVDLEIPTGPGVRFDSMLFEGYTVSPLYDSLIGKLIVWDQDRESAISRLKRALGELQIGGISTTRALFQALSESDDLLRGRINTQWLESWLLETTDIKAPTNNDIQEVDA